MEKNRLSKSIDRIKPYYDVVIIGSGYGGSIAASRLSRLGKKVCLLERGKEYLTGEFPDSSTKALPHIQAHHGNMQMGSKTGLYDFWFNKDISVVKGCGLGGTSLINANVSMRPESWVFEDNAFPKELREEAKNKESDLEKGYQFATQMLRPRSYPKTFPTLKKLEAMRSSAKELDLPLRMMDLNINFDINGKNHIGVEQKPCTLCGNCVTGCNVGAKNTTMMNYLPDAFSHGADIFTQTSVTYIEKKSEKWQVNFEVLNADNSTHLFVNAGIIVLSAGTLGSTEIMLRSKQKGLICSDKVGQGFSGNGDVLGYAYNTKDTINGIGNPKVNSSNPIGPCITSVIDVKKTDNQEENMILQEGSIPSAMSALFPSYISTLSSMAGDLPQEEKPSLEKIKKRWSSILQGVYKGATQHTQTYLMMGHDNSGGVVSLKNNALKIDWKGIGKESNFEKANQVMRENSHLLGGTFVPSPTWTSLFEHSLVTVHPMGGCIMAEDATKGVINHKGQVFTSSTGNEVYENLYIADGSIIPRSLGANPLLTISALSERICRIMARDKNWGEIPYTFNKKHDNMNGKSVTMTENKTEKVSSLSKNKIDKDSIGISFSETMRGYFSTTEKENYQNGYKEGKKNKAKLEATLTISSEDVKFMVKDKKHLCSFIGTLKSEILSDKPLVMMGGKFGLFVDSDTEIETKHMIYTSQLISTNGEIFFFKGYKIIKSNYPWHIWNDTTTLYTTIYKGDSEKSEILGKGIIHITPKEFAKQLTTMKSLNTQNITQKINALSIFLNFFSMTLFKTYGGVLAPDANYIKRSEERPKRELNTPKPTFHPFTTSDGLDLKLTRFQGGTKGPILLSHGFSVSGKIFQIDTIEKNMVEYLCDNDYDVWIMEYRTSIELPSSFNQYTADEIAMKDYPAAVAKILEVAQKPNLQMLTHCVGTLTGMMAILGGLQGVRSMLCMQVGTDVIGGLQINLKAGARIPSLLKMLGGKGITAYSDDEAGFFDKALNFGVKMYASAIGAGSNDPVSNRVTFMFSKLYEKENINQATFKAFHEMFGIANFTTYEQLTLVTRKKELRNHKGEDTYLPYAKDRLNIPICFVHGAENHVFLPEATEKSQKRLQKLNPNQDYTRCLIQGYGHQDCVIGKNAHKDVFPHIVEHFDKTN